MAGVVGSVCGCASNAGDSASQRASVVLYVSADDHIARQIVSAFEAEHDIDVDMLGDSEAKKTTGLVERLRAETDRPRADVFWSSEVFMTIELADEKVFEPYQPANTSDWPERFRDDQHRWYGFAARARVLVYAPDRLPEDERPTTWLQLLGSQWKDRIVMADPRFGTTGGHLAAMRSFWSKRYSLTHYLAYVEGLADNNVRQLPSGNAGVVQAVASGEADIGMTDTDDVWAAQQQGMKVDLIYPAHEPDPSRFGSGTLLIPNTVALVKGGPNPDAARTLIDFLLSEKVERMLAESVSHNIPIRPGLAAQYGEYHVPQPMNVDLVDAASMRTQAIAELAEAIKQDDAMDARRDRSRRIDDEDEDDDDDANELLRTPPNTMTSKVARPSRPCGLSQRRDACATIAFEPPGSAAAMSLRRFDIGNRAAIDKRRSRVSTGTRKDDDQHDARA